MSKMSELGNDLYTGRRGIDYVGRRKLWFTISAIFVALSIAVLAIKGLNLSLEFRGGSQFQVQNVTRTEGYETRAKDAVTKVTSKAGNINVTKVGGSGVRVETEKMEDTDATKVASSLAQEFDVKADAVSSSFVGPSWGQSVTRQAVNALLIFLVVVGFVLAAYFRTWTMSVAAIIAMLHDILVTVGIYTLVGFEISPATMIGFLTILAYSLYDTVVVFDKVKENVRVAQHTGRETFSQASNLAVNQTLVRSINTSMMSVLPVAAVLVVGSLFIGPGVLLDLSLVLFVGILTGAYSSIFIATPVLAMLREREPGMKDLAKRAARFQAAHGGANFSGVLHSDLASRSTHNTLLDDAEAADRAPAPARAATGATSASALRDGTAAPAAPAAPAAQAQRPAAGRRPIHPSVAGGQRSQPKRAPRSKR